MLNHILTLLRDSITDPRKAAQDVLNGAIPRDQIWPFLVLVCVLSGIIVQIGLMLHPMAPIDGVVMPGGIMVGFMVGGSILISTAMVTWIGRAFGGTGQMGDVLLLMTWLQLVMVAFQVVQTALGLIALPLSAMFAWVGIGFLFWLMTNFIAVVHGFTSLGQVFVGMIGTLIALVLVMSVLIGFSTLLVAPGA